jgi:hypothetical protein
MVGRAVQCSVGAVVVTLAVAGSGTAPVTTRYKIETKVETTIDLSAVGGAAQQQNAAQAAYISVGVSDTATGKVIHVAIDSLSSDLPIPGAAEAIAKAKGAWMHGLIDSKGKVTIVKTSADSNDFVAELKSTMRTFFPRLKPGAKQGDSWVDTAEVETKTSSRALKGSVVTTYTHGGDDTIGGDKAVRLDASFTSNVAGTMENPMAGAMEMESKDTGTGKYYLSADGRFLGGSSQSAGNATITAGGQVIPVKVSRTSTVSVVK